MFKEVHLHPGFFCLWPWAGGVSGAWCCSPFFFSNLPWDGVPVFTIMKSIYFMNCVYRLGLNFPCLRMKANKPIKKTFFWLIKPRYAIVCVYIVHNSVHPIAPHSGWPCNVIKMPSKTPALFAFVRHEERDRRYKSESGLARKSRADMPSWISLISAYQTDSGKSRLLRRACGL